MYILLLLAIAIVIVIAIIYEAAQYDVYCWAKDSAVDTQDQPRTEEPASYCLFYLSYFKLLSFIFCSILRLAQCFKLSTISRPALSCMLSCLLRNRPRPNHMTHSIYLSIYLSFFLLSIYLSIYLSLYLCISIQPRPNHMTHDYVSTSVDDKATTIQHYIIIILSCTIP